MSANAPHDLDDALLGRYVAGQCSATDHAAVETWLTADPENAARLQVLQHVWERGYGAAPSATVNAMWDTLAGSLALDHSAPSVVSLSHSRTPLPRRSAAAWSGWMAAAAVLVFSVGLLTRTHLPASIFTRGQSYATAAGERASVTLPDGTHVMLAPDSRLQLAANYGQSRREIELTGEAVFDVIHNAAHPFLVHAGRVVLQDVGTRFDARRYAEDPDVTVTVAEGAVQVGHAMLRAGDAATISNTGVAVQHSADTSSVLAWTAGVIHFDNVPLAVAVPGLSRWYGVDIEVPDTTLAARHVSVTFRSETPAQVLETIDLLVGARTVRDGHRAILYPLTNPTL